MNKWINIYAAGPRRVPPDVFRLDHTKEWALIASIFGGIVDDKHKVQLERHIDTEESAAICKEIFVSGLATQPYRTGLGKFTTRFKPGEPYSATIAIEKGVHGEHGTAIFSEQDNRGCLLTRRLYGISVDDALWFVMKDWAQFQPRLSKPRVDPGLLYYPAEYTHVFEKYWDVLNLLSMGGTDTRSEHIWFHQPRQIAPREGPTTSGDSPAIPLHPALVMS